MDGDLSTPQHSPLSPPYSNETTNPYTPFTDSEPPPTPHPSLIDDDGGEDDEDDGLDHTTSTSKTRSTRKRRGAPLSPDISDLKRRPRNQQTQRGRKRKAQDASVVPSLSPKDKTVMEAETETEDMESMAVVPAKKNRRKSPIKELRMFPRIEMPSTPEVSRN